MATVWQWCVWACSCRGSACWLHCCHYFSWHPSKKHALVEAVVAFELSLALTTPTEIIINSIIESMLGM
eukprot:3357374-Amphidinium_carterae.1